MEITKNATAVPMTIELHEKPCIEVSFTLKNCPISFFEYLRSIENVILCNNQLLYFTVQQYDFVEHTEYSTVKVVFHITDISALIPFYDNLYQYHSFILNRTSNRDADFIASITTFTNLIASRIPNFTITLISGKRSYGTISVL